MNCEWCGDPMPDSNPKRRFCSSICIGESVWANKLRFPRSQARHLYVFQGTHAIAKRFRVTHTAICRALHKMRVELRSKTSTRTCTILGCGKPAYKILVHGYPTGTLCWGHAREKWQRKNMIQKQKRQVS